MNATADLPFTHNGAHRADRRDSRDVWTREDLIDPAELLRTTTTGSAVTYYGRAYSAVCMAMGSDTYTDEERQDAAAEVVARLLAEVTPPARRAPMDPVMIRRATDSAMVADMLRWIDSAEDNAPRVDAAFIPAHLAANIRLYNVACHLRRTIDRNRKRDAIDAAERGAASLTGRTTREDPDAALCASPAGARRVALSTLAMLGYRGEGAVWGAADGATAHPLRKRDAAAFTLAYNAARSAGGAESDAVAEELGITPSAYRKHLSRAAATMRLAGSPAAYAKALAMPDGGEEHPRVEGLPDSMGRRILPGDTFPNVPTERATVPTIPASTRKGRATRKPWHTVERDRRQTADWTRDLPSRTHSRLAAAAVIARKRSAVKSPEVRHADRSAIGMVPYTPSTPREVTWTVPPTAPRSTAPVRTRRTVDATAPAPLRVTPCATVRSMILAAQLAAAEDVTVKRAPRVKRARKLTRPVPVKVAAVARAPRALSLGELQRRAAAGRGTVR